MRRTLVTVALAWCAGLCTAAGAAHGFALLDAWQAYGEQFQLGYVVGYIDAVTLAKRHDQRVYAIPTGGMPKYELWRSRVNDFFADPANAKRSVPDAMAAAGKIFQDEFLKAWAEHKKKATPAPGAATPEPAAPPADPR